MSTPPHVATVFNARRTITAPDSEYEHYGTAHPPHLVNSRVARACRLNLSPFHQSLLASTTKGRLTPVSQSSPRVHLRMGFSRLQYCPS